MDRVEYSPLVVQDILNLHKSNELDLNPWYQRRSVWSTPQKAYLINTIFEGKPIPSCYIRHSLDMELGKSIKEVVDGQQRMRAIIDYVNGSFAAKHPRFNRFVKYDQLEPKDKKAFLMTAISVGYLMGADDSDVIEIFGRLNSVSKTLNPQEKRNARYSGEMKQFCLREASQRVQFWRDYRIFSANDIARMNEVQFIADLVINLLNGLSDYSPAKIDSLYKEFDEDFNSQDLISKRIEKVFEILIKLDPKCITDTIFSRSPLFFSLFLIIDSIEAQIDIPYLQDRLHIIDEKFNSDMPLAERPKNEAAFVNSCTASTQRIRSRQIRDEYIRSHLSLPR